MRCQHLSRIQSRRGGVSLAAYVMTLNSLKMSRSDWVFVSIALGTFVWRGLMIPWDMGGAWLQLWSCLVAVIGLAKLRDTPRDFRAFGAAVVYSIGILIAVGSMYFAPQPLFYFLFLGGLVVVFCCTRPNASKPGGIVAYIAFALLLAAFAYGCLDGILHIRRVLRLKSLQSRADGVALIDLTPLTTNANQPRESIRVVDTNAVAAITEALQGTYPYSPNHERICDPWRVTVQLRSGEKLTFELGRGNRAHPETAWIGFDRGVYQNEHLYQTLTKVLRLPLWT